MRIRAIAFLLLLALWPPQSAAADQGLTLAPPLPGRILRGFDEVGRYDAGHRGVDLAGVAGDPVVSAAAGTVHFAGQVGGVATVSIDHGNGWRTTYQPVAASVSVGEAVHQGQQIGTLRAGHCLIDTCLHWGLTDGTNYADPLLILTDARVRLLPRGSSPRTAPSIPAASASSSGALPVSGRLSSGFGPRVHPITGVMKLHDGTDIAAACGSPVVSPRAGVVTKTVFSHAYGWRVFVTHADSLVTAYNHLPGLDVQVGDQLTAGQQLGRVGNTGLSTGCHLHWMAWQSGRLIDPLKIAGG